MKSPKCIIPVLVCLGGCASNTNDRAGKAGPGLSDGDNQFLTTVTESNLTEIHSSQMALNVSQNDGVKKFAQMMVDDHKQAAAKGVAVAMANGITPPTKLDSAHQSIVDGLKEKTGTDFDQAYLDVQIRAHEATIGATENEANNGNNQQVKNLASDLLPVLQKHLAAAQSLQSGHLDPKGQGV